MKQNNNIKSLDQFVNEQYGEKGTLKRDKFEKGFEAFKLGFLLQQARLEKGLTQEELAEAETDDTESEAESKDDSDRYTAESTGDVTQIYLNEIGQSKLLTPDEERALSRRVVQGDFSARKKIRRPRVWLRL